MTGAGQVVADREYDRILAQEELVLDATERVCAAMKDADVSRAELANRLGTTRGYVSQLLDGSRNMTLRTLSDLAFSLGMRFSVHLTPKTESAPAVPWSQAGEFFVQVHRALGSATTGRSPVFVDVPNEASVQRVGQFGTTYRVTRLGQPAMGQPPVSQPPLQHTPVTGMGLAA
jgi:transcriptional regulator with XRE-family HTH domain